VDASGGASVSSREGYGTTITVTLPLAAPPDASTAQAAATRAPSTGP